MYRNASISPTGTYRWWLLREWDIEGARICWIMLNPSTADAEVDDPTIRRCIKFSQRWGFGSLVVVNLFPIRSSTTEVAKIFSQSSVLKVKARNDREVLKMARESRKVVCAWGAAPWAQEVGEWYVDILLTEGINTYCLRETQRGCPTHPLARGEHRIPDDVQLVPF